MIKGIEELSLEPAQGLDKFPRIGAQVLSESGCNATACGLAIAAVDAAVIAMVLICTASLGSGCAAGAALVLGALSNAAAQCEGCMKRLASKD